jgi:hypothetical protein
MNFISPLLKIVSFICEIKNKHEIRSFQIIFKLFLKLLKTFYINKFFILFIY